eukprot:6155147-Pyramimonas_sp.AAC.1
MWPIWGRGATRLKCEYDVVPDGADGRAVSRTRAPTGAGRPASGPARSPRHGDDERRQNRRSGDVRLLRSQDTGPAWW